MSHVVGLTLLDEKFEEVSNNYFVTQYESE